MFLDWKNSVKMIILPKAIYRFSARKGKSESRSLVSSSLRPHGLYSPWHSPGQNTGVGSLSLLQGIFSTPRTIASQAPLSMGILQARILEWVAIASSRGSSQPRDRTQVSGIAGRFFTSWATREYIYKTGTDSQTEKTNVWLSKGITGGKRQIRSLGVTYTHYYI